MSSQDVANSHAGAGMAGDPQQHTQFASLCWRMHDGRPEILLITSRDTGRWVLPKGWPMDGRSPSEAAEREAWEEAGVTGKVLDESLGTYSYAKTRSEGEALPCAVEVFPLRVASLAKKFPEKRQRRRKWFDPEKAARKVNEPELRDLIADFARGFANESRRPHSAAGDRLADEAGNRKPAEA